MNMILWCIEAGISTVYAGIGALLFVEKKSGYTVFFSSAGYLSFNASVSTSVTILLIDRIFVLCKAAKYYKYKHKFKWITICGVLAIVLINIAFYTWAEFSTIDLVTECYALACLAKSKYTIEIGLGLRLIIGFVNGILAVILEIVLCKYAKKSLTSQKQFKRANFLTIVIAVTEIFFIFLPNLIYVICTYLEIDHYSKIGPYGIDAHAFSALLTAGIYRFVINSSVSGVTHNSQGGSQAIRTFPNSSSFIA